MVIFRLLVGEGDWFKSLLSEEAAFLELCQVEDEQRFPAEGVVVPEREKAATLRDYS